VAAFSHDFYVDADDARSAVRTQQLFNLLHLESGVKVDFIVRKDASSELQRRDVKALLDGPYDQTYVQQWAALLEVADLLKEIAR